MNIFISTSNKGLHIIEAFQYLFDKYWDVTQSVTILGWDNKPDFELSPNFQFVSLGEDKGPKIGGALIDFFSSIEDEHLVYTVDSHLPIHPVLTRLFEYLVYLIEHSDRIGRIALTGDMEVNQPHSLIRLADSSLAEHSQTSNYRISAVWSLWSKGYFLKYLKPDMDLWEWETAGSERAKGDGVQILSNTGRYPLTVCRIYKRGLPHAGSFRSWDKYGAVMLEEDQAIVRPIMRGPTWCVAREGVSRGQGGYGCNT